MKTRNYSNIFVTTTGMVLLSLLFIGLFIGCGAQKVQITKEKESAAYYKFGLAYLNENPPKTHNAYIEFIKAVEADSKNGEAYYALGHLYFLRQEYAKSIDAFKKTLKITPNFSAASNYMGQAMEMEGREEEAIISYQEATNNSQYDTPQLPHWNLARLYKKQKQYAKALSELQEVRRVEPKNSVVLHEIGDIYKKIGTPARARPLYEEAAQISPNDHQAHYVLASFYLQEGLLLEAANAFKKVIQLSPESDEAKKSKEQLGVMNGGS